MDESIMEGGRERMLEGLRSHCCCFCGGGGVWVDGWMVVGGGVGGTPPTAAAADTTPTPTPTAMTYIPCEAARLKAMVGILLDQLTTSIITAVFHHQERETHTYIHTYIHTSINP